MRLPRADTAVIRRRALCSVWAAFAVNTALLPSAQLRAVAAGGPSSLSGKPRPETGVVLLEPPVQTGATISAEMLVANANTKLGGISAVSVFESPYPLAKGNYYDIEGRNKEGDAAFVHVAAVPAGMNLETLPNSFFAGAALGPTGRFGSYSAPQLTKVSTGASQPKGSSGDVVVPARFVEVSFNALTQSGFEVPRKGVIAALQDRAALTFFSLPPVGTRVARATRGQRRRAFASRAHVRRAFGQRTTMTTGTTRAASRVSPKASPRSRRLARDSTQSGSLGGRFADAARSGVRATHPTSEEFACVPRSMRSHICSDRRILRHRCVSLA